MPRQALGSEATLGKRMEPFGIDDEARAREIAATAHRRVAFRPRSMALRVLCYGLCAGASIAFCDWMDVRASGRWAFTFVAICMCAFFFSRWDRAAKQREVHRILESEGGCCGNSGQSPIIRNSRNSEIRNSRNSGQSPIIRNSRNSEIRNSGQSPIIKPRSSSHRPDDVASSFQFLVSG